MHRIDEALKVRGQKHKQNLPENCSKALKWPLQYSMPIFKNFPGEHAPGPPRVVFVT